MMNLFQNFSFKTFFYRAYLTLLALLTIYALTGIVHFKWMYMSVEKPKAEFLIQAPSKPTSKPITVIEFIDYTCPHCKNLHPTVEELLSVRKDIRYIVRPIAFDEETSEPILRHVLSAGLQGKFWEMHRAVMEHPDSAIPPDFFEQTATLYGLDIEKFLKDVSSKQVDDIIKDNTNAMGHANIQVTPSFLIKSKVYIPNNSVPTLVDLINMVKEGE
jgi:protein-disulfide isomerase